MKDPEWAAIASRLRTARADARLSQVRAAELTGIPRTAISDIENTSRKVDALELVALARAYGCTIGHLSGEPNPDQATKPVPCLVCGKELDPIQPGDTQPVGALTLCGSGQYGSSWDPMEWAVALQVNVCDPCLYKNADRVLYVRTETAVRRDVRPWNPEED